MNVTINRLWNAQNAAQGDYKRVLCVCQAGILRSPTIAWVLGRPPYDFNVRAVGVSQDFAVVPVDPVMIKWADVVICTAMTELHEVKKIAHRRLTQEEIDKIDFQCWNIPDEYEYRDPNLVEYVESCAKRNF